MDNDSSHSFIQKILSTCSVTSTMLSIKGYTGNQERGLAGPGGVCSPVLSGGGLPCCFHLCGSFSQAVSSLSKR